jgi:purine-cytosine permease-like protein
MRTLKNVALFFLAPFIGLAYVFAVPLVAVGAIVFVLAKAVMGAIGRELTLPALMVRRF